MNVLTSRLKATPVLMIVLLMLVASIVVLVLNPPASYLADSRQSLYRFAEQLSMGHGMVFNPNERTLLLPSPLYILLLALGAALFSTMSIVTVSQIIFALTLTIGAVAVYYIAHRAEFGQWAAIGLAVLYFVAWPLWAGVGTAYPAMSALCLVVFALAFYEHWQLSGIVLALATLCGPEAVLLAMPLLLLAANRGRALRFITALLLPGLVILLLLLLRVYYGADLWASLLILKDVLPNTLSVGWLLIFSLPLIGLAVWGWRTERKNAAQAATMSTLATWITLYVVIVAGLLRVDAVWKYAPIAGPVLLLAGAGLRSLQPYAARITFAIGAILLVLVSLILVESLPRTTPTLFPMEAHTIGVNTVGQVWAAALSPDQSAISFDGQLQPQLKAMLERGDTESALIRYAPDVLMLGNSGRIRAKDLSVPGVARLNYKDQDGVFVRGAELGIFANFPADAQYGPDVHLSGMALDQSSLKPGQVLRARLDWQLLRQADKPVTIDLWLRSGDYLLAHTVDTYDPSVFKPGAYSTYHTLAVIGSAWAGPVTLEVAVIVNNGVVARYPLATLQVVGS